MTPPAATIEELRSELAATKQQIDTVYARLAGAYPKSPDAGKGRIEQILNPPDPEPIQIPSSHASPGEAFGY